MLEGAGLILSIIGSGLTVILAAILAFYVVRSELRKAREEEQEHLIETRGLTIDDLRRDITTLQAELVELRAHVHYLEQQNTERIAEETAMKVVHELRPFLERT